jgi:hypothetical protein
MTNQQKYEADNEKVQKWIAKMNMSGISINVEYKGNKKKYTESTWILTNLDISNLNTPDITIKIPQLKHNAIMISTKYRALDFKIICKKNKLTLDFSALPYANLNISQNMYTKIFLPEELRLLGSLISLAGRESNFSIIIDADDMTKIVESALKIYPISKGKEIDLKFAWEFFKAQSNSMKTIRMFNID